MKKIFSIFLVLAAISTINSNAESYLMWRPIVGAKEYNVYIESDTGFVTVHKTKNTKFKLDLLGGYDYIINVVPYDGKQFGPKSNKVTVNLKNKKMKKGLAAPQIKIIEEK